MSSYCCCAALCLPALASLSPSSISVSLLSNIPEPESWLVRRCHIYANCRGFKLDARRAARSLAPSPSYFIVCQCQLILFHSAGCATESARAMEFWALYVGMRLFCVLHTLMNILLRSLWSRRIFLRALFVCSAAFLLIFY